MVEVFPLTPQLRQPGQSRGGLCPTPLTELDELGHVNTAAAGMRLRFAGLRGAITVIIAALLITQTWCAELAWGDQTIFDPGVGWTNPANPAVPARPPTDEQIQAAIGKGVDYLWSQQKQNGSWDTSLNWHTAHPLASTSMACYALLECGVTPKNERLKKALDWLVTAVDDPLYQPGADSTYTLGFRTQVWLLANQRSGDHYLASMKRDVERLKASTPSGGYDYLCTGKPEYEDHHRPDNSNSQFALYGVWAGKLNQVDVSNAYWEKVQKYWMEGQCPDGGWNYLPTGKSSRITLAEAGLASLYVCFDSLYGPRFVPVGAQPPEITQGMERALAYLDFNFPRSLQNPVLFSVNNYLMYYHLFGIQRAGLATGHKRFGGLNWYEAGTSILLPMQKPDGSWSAGGFTDGNPTDVVWTSYALIFLARGQRPLPFVHLNWAGDWNNRPHALPNFYLWMGQTLERRYRLEVVGFDDPDEDFQDSKILFITGSQDPKLNAKQIERLRAYIAQGGTLFTSTEGNGEGFRTGIRKAYKELFPWSVLRPMTQDHPIQTIHVKLAGKIPFSYVTDGGRLLAIHTDYDLTKDWQINDPKSSPLAFQAGTNVYLYVDRQAKAATTQALSKNSVWMTLTPEQLHAWGNADEPLLKAVKDYEDSVDQLQTTKQENLKTARAEISAALGQPAKDAAKMGKVKEAMAILDARKAFEEGKDVDFGAIPFSGLDVVQQQYAAKMQAIEEEFGRGLHELDTHHDAAMKEAKGTVLQRLKEYLPNAVLADVAKVRGVIAGIEADVGKAH